MRSLAVLALALALAVAIVAPRVGWTAVSCPDRLPLAIAAPAADSVKCQTTIAKSALKFAKIKLKTSGKCLAKQEIGLCPDAKGTDKITATAMKLAEKIAKDCAADSVQAGLTSSYAALADDAVITSCMLSQHNATADVLLGLINGTPGRVLSIAERDKCAKTLNKTGIKQATGAHKIVNKCLATQMKLGTAGDLSEVCVGHWSGGVFVPPTDVKTADKLSGLQVKTEDAIAKGCVGPTSIYIPSLFACPGATTIADLQQCIVCASWDGVLDFVDQENSESGTYVANGPGALQAAVSAASPGAKLLIGSGDYAEQVTITTPGLQLVGCGGATGDRPNIVRPTSGGPYGDGIAAASVNGLLFQSLDVTNWDENGIHISNADGVTFRDVHADGALNSTYGIFPVGSNDVLIETSSATQVRDAGIYVGQSTNILSRYNRAEGNVAGMEIENSANATVHNNYAADNTGGLLVFKLPDLPVQLSNGHQVFDNVSVHNNTPNFGIPGSIVSTVPDGTGMLIISNDDGEFTYNISQDNDSIGLALVDQQAVNFLVPPDPVTHLPPFPTLSPDQKAENNKIHNNRVSGNGANPASPVGGNVLFALVENSLPHGNCLQSNGSPPIFVIGANDCP
jgi:parallel beta-helix repeat protein